MIKLDNINKSFDKRIIFKNFSIEFEDKKITSIYGKSGVGKSTLLNIIGILETIDSGTYYLNEHKNPKVSSREGMLIRRNEVSYVFQNFALIEDETVEKNLMYALEYKKLSNKEKKVKIREVINDLNIIDKLQCKVYTLSGGEAQRVAIARVILHDTPIILADEPTGQLDEENKSIILNLLVKLNKKGKTIIIATHDPEIAKISDVVINL